MNILTKDEVEMISCIVLEMSDRCKVILNLFPKDKKKEKLLRHLAAASVHLLYFMRDITNNNNGIIKISEEYKKEEKLFLNECGCNNE